MHVAQHRIARFQDSFSLFCSFKSLDCVVLEVELYRRQYHISMSKGRSCWETQTLVGSAGRTHPGGRTWRSRMIESAEIR